MTIFRTFVFFLICNKFDYHFLPQDLSSAFFSEQHFFALASLLLHFFSSLQHFLSSLQHFLSSDFVHSVFLQQVLVSPWAKTTEVPATATSMNKDTNNFFM